MGEVGEENCSLLLTSNPGQAAPRPTGMTGARNPVWADYVKYYVEPFGLVECVNVWAWTIRNY